jgi:hypothetical protein
MKGKKGIIRYQQNKSARNSDDDKLDQIGMALVEIGINFARNVFLVFDSATGKLVSEGIFVSKKYLNNRDYQINNCDIVANIAGKKIYIELDGEGIHGVCDSSETITKKTRERNRRYTNAGLIWFALNETLAKFAGFKKEVYGDLTAFICLSFIQKLVSISDISKE